MTYKNYLSFYIGKYKILSKVIFFLKGTDHVAKKVLALEVLEKDIKGSKRSEKELRKRKV